MEELQGIKKSSVIVKDTYITKGIWSNGTNVIPLLSSKGIPQHKIKFDKNDLFLVLEDAVYLMHKGDMIITYRGINFSIQEVYSLMFSNKEQMSNCILYNYLSNFGFKIIKPQFDNKSDVNYLTKKDSQNINCSQENLNICTKSSKISDKEYSTCKAFNKNLNEMCCNSALWQGKTKPLLDPKKLSLTPFKLSSCAVSRELMSLEEEENVPRVMIDKRSPYNIYFNHQKKVKTVEKPTELIFFSKNDDKFLKYVCANSVCNRERPALIAVDSEAEFRFFYFSSVLSAPQL